MAPSTTSGLYALIIGINDYQTEEVTKLKGAVQDAGSIEKWLVDALGVPPGRIRNLRDKTATRKNIISEFRNLATNENIAHGDPIFIYYAGHGSEGPPPKKWHWDTPKIQMILPWDYMLKDERSKRIIHGIPDRTLGFLLSQIFKAKGDNITVVFDCCHSGSGTRSDGDTRVRGVYLDTPITDNLDSELFASTEPNDGGSRGMKVSEKFRHPGLRSHILLAACAPHEKALEEKNSGNFTRILLKALAATSTTEITYEGLFSTMDNLTGQTPQCEGYWKGRYLFDRKAPNTKAVYEAMFRRLARGPRLFINAGALHGIEPGTKLGLWKSRSDVQNPRITTVEVSEVEPLRSIVEQSIPTSDDNTVYAAQIVGRPPRNLAIYVPDVIQRMDCFRGHFTGTKNALVVTLCQTKELADVGLTYDARRNKIGFEILSIEEKKQKILYVIDPTMDEIRRVIEHLSFYYYHRSYINPKPQTLGDTAMFFVPDVVQKMECFEQLYAKDAGREPVDIRLTTERRKATVVVTYDAQLNTIRFESPEDRREGKEIYHSINPTADELYRAVKFLSVQTQKYFKDMFTVNVFVLEEEDLGDNETGIQLVPAGPNLNVEGVGVELVVGKHNEEDEYGFLVQNHTKLDVFPYLFYFDTSSFSISCIYEPEATTQGKVDPPLKAGGSLEIGYGASTVDPQTLSISSQSLDLEMGYLRLYLSTTLMKDLKTSIVQGEISDETIDRGLSSSKKALARTRETAPIWDCISVPITMTRGAKVDPVHMIGIIGSKGNGKHTFLSELFKTLHGSPALKPSYDNTFIKEYTIEIPGQKPVTLVDLPAFQDDNIDNYVVMLKATMAYLTVQYQTNRRFISMIWCTNISSRFTGIDSRNLDLVQDLSGPAMFNKIVVLTTQWNRGVGAGSNAAVQTSRRSLASAVSPLGRYLSKEEQLKNHPSCCKRLLEAGATLKRFGVFEDPSVRDAHPATQATEQPLDVIKSLLRNSPQVLQSQEDACRTRVLGETAPGRRLCSDIKRAVLAKEREIRSLNLELQREKENSAKWSVIMEERMIAEEDIVRWEKTLVEIGEVNSALT